MFKDQNTTHSTFGIFYKEKMEKERRELYSPSLPASSRSGPGGQSYNYPPMKTAIWSWKAPLKFGNAPEA